MKTETRLKVWGLSVTIDRLPKRELNANGGAQKRAIVAAPTQKRAAELFGVPVSHLRVYGSITGNAAEIAKCMASPEQPFYYAERYDPETIKPFPK